jgi:phosphatidylserine decarboxylase
VTALVSTASVVARCRAAAGRQYNSHVLTTGLDRAGWPFILGAVVVAAAGAWLGGRLWALPGALLVLGFVFFFRDPDRPLPSDQSLVVSPADGEVKFVGAAVAGGPAGTWQQITIFLSPLDVHINRSPVAGRVTRVTYKPGQFLPAYRPESGAVNEQAEVWVDHDGRAAVYRQVVGIMARRVVSRVQEGDQLRVGQRVGVMKFGSRMDVFLPTDLPVHVAAGDRVVGGVTVLSRWNGR